MCFAAPPSTTWWRSAGSTPPAWLDPARRPGAEVLCWSAVHGFASLHLDSSLREVAAQEREQSLGLVLAHISRGLGPGGAAAG